MTRPLGGQPIAGSAGSSPSRRGLDLLSIGSLRGFLASPLYPLAFQLPAALIFAIVLLYGFFGADRASVNPGTLLTWSIWWPLLPLALLLSARLFCTMCPVAAAVDWVQRLVPIPRLTPGPFLRRYGIWVMLGTFILLTWVDRLWGLRNDPVRTAAVLLAVFGAGVLVAVVYQRSTWCRYLCPIGAFTGVYAMLAPVELRARAEVCRQCTTRDCYRGNARAQGCPFYEFPRTMDTNRNCSLCARCIKACPHDSLELRLRAPATELALLRRPIIGEALFAVLLVGLVFIQTVDMTVVWGSYMRWLVEGMGLASYRLGFGLTFVGSLGLAVAGYGGAALLSARAAAVPFGRAFASFGYAYLPLVLGAHLGHNLSHLVTEALPALMVLARQVTQPFARLEPVAAPGLTIHNNLVGLGLFAVGAVATLVLTWKVTGREGAGHRLAAFVPHLALVLALAALFGWMFLLPMNPVHSH